MIACPQREILRELEVVAHQEARVAFCRGGARAEVQYEIERTHGAAVEARDQVVRVEVILKAQGDQVAPFFIRAQPVGDDDAIDAVLVEGPHQRAANEPGATRHKDAVRESGERRELEHGRPSWTVGREDPESIH
jgi:hypothetical protein